MGFQQGEEDICLDILANRSLLLPNTWNHSQKSYDPRKKNEALVKRLVFVWFELVFLSEAFQTHSKCFTKVMGILGYYV